LLGGDLAEFKRHFIDKLNQRAEEYADFKYGETGPDFSFMRYLGYCMKDIMDEKDSDWILDQIVSIEAPESVKLVEKAFRGFLDTEARPPRRHPSSGGD
jgi:hypothetical protein